MNEFLFWPPYVDLFCVAWRVGQVRHFGTCGKVEKRFLFKIFMKREEEGERGFDRRRRGPRKGIGGGGKERRRRRRDQESIKVFRGRGTEGRLVES